MTAIDINPSATPPQVMLRSDSGTTPLPALWLRARSYDPSQRDLVTGQRLMNPHQLPTDLQLTAARWNADESQLHLAFSDGFAGDFDPQELMAGAVLSEECPAPRPWTADISPQPSYAWADLAQDAVLHRALRDFITLGFLLVHGSPTQADSILEVAQRFG